MIDTIEVADPHYRQLTTEQQDAVELLCSLEPIAGVAGSAGTGKTTLILPTYQELIRRGLKVALAAPTGRAAKRLFEVTGIKGITAHRLLEYPLPGAVDPETGKPYRKPAPQRTAEKPLEFDVVLIDEFSMVNWEINNNLLAALPTGKLRGIGDHRQLQPVETDPEVRKQPSPFHTVLAECPCFVLKEPHRQALDSGIIANSNRILKSRIPIDTNDFTLVQVDTYAVSHVLADWVKSYPVEYLFDIENQIITPTNKGVVGTKALNNLFVKRILEQGNINGALHTLQRYRWDREHIVRVAPGFKVIQTVNSYDLDVMNGETGIVKQILPNQDMIIDFGDRVIPYPFQMIGRDQYGFETSINPQRDLDLAFVITTNKSQGSEYQNVIYVMDQEQRGAHRISNFYTAVTRARNHVTVITDENALIASITRI